MQAKGTATARAGNAIGGGDWGMDRIVPDAILAYINGRKLRIRNPEAVRPWQYVLDALSGYLTLVEKLYAEPKKFSGAWNFGPGRGNAVSVRRLVTELSANFRGGINYSFDKGKHPHEARYLYLDCNKSNAQLGWRGKYGLKELIESTACWYDAFLSGADVREYSLMQIGEYEKE
jgi:CDP-glucose 4,6-dehydratase